MALEGRDAVMLGKTTVAVLPYGKFKNAIVPAQAIEILAEQIDRLNDP
jgi:hypothetical protein